MPGGDELVILERLKSNRLLSHIPVIVVTAHDRQIVEVETRRLGAVAYLQNPVQPDALLLSLLTVGPSDGPPEDGVAHTGELCAHVALSDRRSLIPLILTHLSNSITIFTYTAVAIGSSLN